MAQRAGRFALLEQFRADGFEYMFGNPGTVEQGFLDALGEVPELEYIATLQETIAVGIADGRRGGTGCGTPRSRGRRSVVTVGPQPHGPAPSVGLTSVQPSSVPLGASGADGTSPATGTTVGG